MASSRGFFTPIFQYIHAKPITSIFVGGAAYLSGQTLATGSLPSLPFYSRQNTPTLNSSGFTPYTLIAKHQISPSSSIFILRPPASDRAVTQLAKIWNEGNGLWSVQAKQPQLQIGREYTPLPPTKLLGGEPSIEKEADIHLLIRREKNGEMTTYLDNLPIESTISLRGPYQDVRIPKEVDEVLFLAGGTGISPALQVAHIMAKRPGTKVHVMWANRKGDECSGASVASANSGNRGIFSGLTSLWNSSAVPAVTKRDKGLVVQILEEMKNTSPKGQFSVHYYVDEEDSFIRSKEVKQILANKPNTAGEGRKLIMVSGPEGFVDYWAGRKHHEAGREAQGPLAGRLGSMELNGWKVWKL
jgi:NAD(P)H-flavin reductase